MEPPFSQMHVAMILFDGDTPLHRCRVLITSSKSYSFYGAHTHFHVAPEQLEVHLLSGLLIEHQFELPACPVEMRFLRVVETGDPAIPYRQEQVFKAAVQMGVHQSDEWESLQLDKHTLAFYCTPRA